MGKFRPVKFLLSITIIVILVASVYIFADEDGSIGINLNLPTNAFITFIDENAEEHEVEIANFVIEDVACWIQVEMKVVGGDGKIIDTQISKFVKLNPQIPLALFDASNIFTAGKTLTGDGGFIINPVIMCSVSPKGVNPDVAFDHYKDDHGITQTSPFTANILVKPSDLVIRIYSSDRTCGASIDIFNDEYCGNFTTGGALFGLFPSKLFHDTYNNKLHINEQLLTDNGKQSLGTLMINDEDIESNLESGRYSSTMIITVDGLVKVAYEVVPDYEYILPLSTERKHVGNVNHPFFKDNNWEEIENPLITYRTLDVAHNVNSCGLIGQVTGTCVCPPAQHIVIVNGQDMCVPDSAPKHCQTNEVYDAVLDMCVEVVVPPTKICSPPLIKQGTICVNPNNTGGTPTGGTGIEVVDQFIACITSGNPDCLSNPDFIVIWLALVGFIILIVAIVQGASRSRPVDIYGVPSNF